MNCTRRQLLRGAAALAAFPNRIPAAATSVRRMVAAGSENRTYFALIDFTDPSSPKTSRVDPGFGAGVRVALGATSVAAGSVLSGAVRIIDLVSSATPVLRGTLQTNLSGVGAIAIRGSLVAVGESINSYKARVNIIDFSRPDSPVLLASAQTPLVSTSTAPDKSLAAIASVAFLSDQRVAVSGASDIRVVEVDFGNPSSPLVSSFLPGLGPPVLDADSARGLLVVGDSGGRLVKTFNAATSTQVAAIATSQASITSLSVSSAGFALATGAFSFTIDKVDLLGLTSSSFSPSLNGGLVTAVDELTGACGEINGTRIALLDMNGIPRVVSVVDSGLASVSTLAIGNIVSPPAVKPPTLVVTPASVVFPMTLLSSTAKLEIQNTGGSTLSARNIGTSDARFSASASGVDIAAGGTQTLTLKFAVSKGGGQYKANLTMTTNDPGRPTASVQLSCIVGVH